ncbi:lamin tail domain-containing protein, partial [Candidatus Poribacteria bacterium]|nr:lamin tail domain-containing protein [Candidatus Poribacteria bacterium]
MKRLVLNSVFCLLFMTILVLVAMPAMAIVDIRVSGTYTVITSTTPDSARLVVKLTYSEAPDPKPTEGDLTILSTAMTPSIKMAELNEYDENEDEQGENDPTTYYITWTGTPYDPTYDPATYTGPDLPDTQFIVFEYYSNLEFTLQGFQTTFVSALTPNVEFTYIEYPFDVSPDAATQPVIGPIDDKLVYHPGYLPGKGYAIVVADKTVADMPALPTNSPPYEIIKVSWSDVSDESMPNLWTLFQSGGTLNLTVYEPGPPAANTNRIRLGSTNNEDSTRNQRQVVINEVMWAQDESQIGDAALITQEQWIELYNTTTSPIAFAAPTALAYDTSATPPETLPDNFSDIKLEYSTAADMFRPPPPETDRLSNIPDLVNTWSVSSKGQHGSSETPRREFKSMKRLDANTDGSDPANWSISTNLFLRNYRGTPGKPNRPATIPTARVLPSIDNPAKDKIIINEIGNLSDNTLDWIELRNVTNSAQSLNNWVLTKTTGYGNETEIIRFPDYTIPARGLLLLVNRVPWQTPLSLGFDIQEDEENQEFGAAPHRYLVVDANKLAIPNDDAWLLLLRSNKPWDVSEGRDVYQTGYRVEDAAGPGALHTAFEVLDVFTLEGARREKKSDGQPNGDYWHTKVFPLNGFFTEIEDDFLQSDRLNEAGKVWVRDGAKQGFLKDAWTKAGFTGIGYDRSVRANDQHSGTPGYDNDVAKGKIAQLDGGKLIISELMLTTSNNRLPQWIELYNTSRTRAIQLAADSSDPKTGWQLIIENHDSGSWKENKRNLNITVNLKDLFTYIPPNQTVLIAASEGRPSDRDHFPDTRVASIFQELRNKFSMTSRRDPILNAEGGFYIRIVDGDGTVSDEVGNLDGIPPNPRQDIGIDDPYSWNWSSALTEEGDRTSLIRLRNANGRPRIAVPNRELEGDLTGAVLPLGMKKARPPKYAWVHAVDTAFTRVPKIWYGESK